MKRIAIASTRHVHPYDSVFKFKQDFVNEAYIDMVKKANAVPFIIPYTKPVDCEGILEGFDALVIPGGPDIDPVLYGEENSPLCLNVDPELDRFQQTLISVAQKENIPIFGVCRGLQLINVVYGGTLYQDLKTQKEGSIEHMRCDEPYTGVHKVKLVENSFLYSLFTEENIMVNSLHHQGINKLGFGLKATAFSSDNLVEAIEGENILALQWHPESMNDGMEEIFKAFIEEFVSE